MYNSKVVTLNKIKEYIISLICCIFLTGTGCYAKSTGNEDHTDQDHHEIQKHELEMGKRLFYGLVKTESGEAVNCASCHYTTIIDTLNWNPSAYDIAVSISNIDSLGFANLVQNPVTKKLSDAHKDISLTGEELQLIRIYLGIIKTKGLEPPKPNISGLLFFILLLVLFITAFTGLITRKYFGKRYINTIIVLITALWITKILSHEGIKLGRSQDYAPLQPIKFSHKVHADDNQIDCKYCHHTADFTKSAGLPSANVCLNCHLLVREGTNSGRFEINKIHAAVDSGIPIEWIRIHRLADFVYFSHAQHVGAGKIECAECHGPVEESHVLKQFSDLSMGWCLDCHRTRKVQFVDNDYYGKSFAEYHEKIVNGEIDSITVEQIGGTDCMKCHY